ALTYLWGHALMPQQYRLRLSRARAPGLCHACSCPFGPSYCQHITSMELYTVRRAFQGYRGVKAPRLRAGIADANPSTTNQYVTRKCRQQYVQTHTALCANISKNTELPANALSKRRFLWFNIISLNYQTL